MNRTACIVVGITILAAVILLTLFGPARRPELWQTADQRADRLFVAQHYAAAAKLYVEPSRQGAALYRAGDYKGAVAAFARDASPDGPYNRANALVMLGKYEDAVKSYDRALSLRPGWNAAEENRAIAKIRRDRMNFKGGDDIGGQEKADSVVFGKEKHAAGEEVQVAGGEPLSDDQLRALWLRRVQTKPADFLRTKFAFQAEERAGGAK